MVWQARLAHHETLLAHLKSKECAERHSNSYTKYEDLIANAMAMCAYYESLLTRIPVMRVKNRRSMKHG